MFFVTKTHLTVFFQITPPLVGDALAVGALEEVRAASRPVAVRLVAPVAAVVVEVATPKLGNAFLAVGTGELKDRLIYT